MFQSRPLSSLLLVTGIVSASWACSSGGETPDAVVIIPTAGTGSTTGGSGNSGGTGSPVPTAGTSATTGGADSGQAGSQASAGSGGMVVATGGTGGSASGGTGGGAAGGTGGAAGGATGGTGGGPNTSFCGTEAGKVVLFDGSDATFKSWYPRNGGMSAANPWTLNADKTMTVKGSDIISKMGFQNVCLHIEYQAPKYTYSAGTDAQERGNSGIYLKGSWEAQVLDTFDLGKTQNDFCGAIYKVAAPLVSACKTGGEWNSYDIEFAANVCTGGTTTTPAKFVKVNLNGVNVHNNIAVPATNPTEAGLTPTCDPRGVLLQNHSSIVPVSFRNIWAIPRP